MATSAAGKRFDEAQRSTMDGISRSLGTKSAKIRALSEAGFTRAQIAEFLGIRYQHVRNVLGDLHIEESPLAPEPDSPSPPPFGAAVVDAEGRLILPRGLLAALQVAAGGAAPWRLENDELTIMGRESGLRFVQELAARTTSGSAESWTDQLHAERRAEAAAEEARERNG